MDREHSRVTNKFRYNRIVSIGPGGIYNIIIIVFLGAVLFSYRSPRVAWSPGACRQDYDFNMRINIVSTPRCVSCRYYLYRAIGR